MNLRLLAAGALASLAVYASQPAWCSDEPVSADKGKMTGKVDQQKATEKAEQRKAKDRAREKEHVEEVHRSKVAAQKRAREPSSAKPPTDVPPRSDTPTLKPKKTDDSTPLKD